jgi:hypothetical protein
VAALLGDVQQVARVGEGFTGKDTLKVLFLPMRITENSFAH